jgi:hypothetical protein
MGSVLEVGRKNAREEEITGRDNRCSNQIAGGEEGLLLSVIYS